MFNIENHNENKVTNLESFLDQLPRLIQKREGNFFYRGQNDSYPLLPAVLRGSLNENEHDIYNEIMTECSHEFEGITSHGEILSKMQHYGVPTRLLDVTANPLVALYYACEDDININSNKDGVVYVFKPDSVFIKYFDSDAVSILSCLPRINNEEKNAIKEYAKKEAEGLSSYDDIVKFNNHFEVSRLLHEIKKEKPQFENIIDPLDLLQNFLFIPKKNNSRIIRQSGAFIIFGLEGIESCFNNDSFDANKIIVDKAFKKIILEQLSCFGISKATLYPELYKVAEFIKEKYQSRR